MTQVNTNLRNLRESARLIRFEPSGAITATNVQDAIDEITGTTPSITPTIVDVTNIVAGAYTVQTTDTALLVNFAGAVTINLQAASLRAGVPLLVKDISGAASTNIITLTPAGAETIDGMATLPINSDFGGWNIGPETGGYFIVP